MTQIIRIVQIRFAAHSATETRCQWRILCINLSKCPALVFFYICCALLQLLDHVFRQLSSSTRGCFGMGWSWSPPGPLWDYSNCLSQPSARRAHQLQASQRQQRDQPSHAGYRWWQALGHPCSAYSQTAITPFTTANTRSECWSANTSISLACSSSRALPFATRAASLADKRSSPTRKICCKSRQGQGC